MKLGQIINGYQVIGVDGKDFSTKGGGLSVWTFVRKDGVIYFMKEFLSPKYPLDNALGSVKSIAKKKLECEAFEQHHKALILKVAKSVSVGGNLIFTRDFFRHNTKYYKVTEKIDVSSISIENISKLELGKRLLILKTISHSLQILHKLGIVHGDLKPNNILIKANDKGYYTSKLIDFDNCYFEGQPPIIREEVVGDPVYYSPELENYVLNKKSTPGSKLRCKSDIFALGVIFSQYLTGKLPSGVSVENYASNVVNNGGNIKIADEMKLLPVNLKSLINSMMRKTPRGRPSIDIVFNVLKEISSSYKISEDESFKHEILDSPKALDEITVVRTGVPKKNIIKTGRLSISMGWKKAAG